MDPNINKLVLEPPAGFVAEEMTASWRVALQDDLKEARAPGMTQLPVRPNLIVQRRKVDAAAHIGGLVAAVCADLVRHIAGISTIDSDEFTFADGKVGLLIKYTMPAHKEFKLAQMQAARLDDDVLTTVTISTELSRLNPATVELYVKSLASVSLAQ
ncbi:MAG: hypothetical protein Q8O67_33470 [Deltaproteobacteria bacterium]|nr:hypothetical protein [Deltaproteobacteria bacterium]